MSRHALRSPIAGDSTATFSPTQTTKGSALPAPAAPPQLPAAPAAGSAFATLRRWRESRRRSGNAAATIRASTLAPSASEAPTPATTTAPAPAPTHILRELGVIGYDHLEPVIIAALALEAPLLLVGEHGTAKSFLLCRLAEAFGLEWRHFNAALVNYDDLIGYPVPDADGSLRFVQTPASVWGAEAVFIDELSRARPDMLNRLFPIIHERKVQGLPLEKLRYRWAAMNPPVDADAIDLGSVGATIGGSPDHYLGSEELDPALADRFPFVVEVPAWRGLSAGDQAAVARHSITPVTTPVRERLASLISLTQDWMPRWEAVLGNAVTAYVVDIMGRLSSLGIALSGRRATMLFQNIVAVHAARQALGQSPEIGDSIWMALSSSIPQRARAKKLDLARMLAAHRAAFALVSTEDADPRRVLAAIPDRVQRCLQAMSLQCLTSQELSSYCADALSGLPAGGRHALAFHLMTRCNPERLIVPVLDQLAQLHAMCAEGAGIELPIQSAGPRFQLWRHIEASLAAIDPARRDFPALANLLTELFRGATVVAAADVDRAIAQWESVWGMCDRSVLVVGKGSADA
ncbi:MAG: AAA family ATPase [Planctomycetota bacterium]|nr:AAA family ATPase [Planctomycetota bacterium]